MTKFSCLIIAGGRGTRFGAKKQNVIWKGKPLWKHVYDKCIQVSDDVYILGYSKFGRQGAVKNGLRKVKYDIVVILEAARPCVRIDQIQRIAGLVTKYDSPSVSFYIPSVDTIYLKDYDHLRRDRTLQLQVPQAFDTDLLKKCHECIVKTNLTSDTEIVQTVTGIRPLLIYGGINLMKVTYKTDLNVLDVLIDAVEK